MGRRPGHSLSAGVILELQVIWLSLQSWIILLGGSSKPNSVRQCHSWGINHWGGTRCLAAAREVEKNPVLGRTPNHTIHLHSRHRQLAIDFLCQICLDLREWSLQWWLCGIDIPSCTLQGIPGILITLDWPRCMR